MSIRQRMDHPKLECLCVLPCDSAMRRNEVLIWAVVWMNPENTLSERSWGQESHAVWFPSHEMPRVGGAVETECRWVVCRDGAGGVWGEAGRWWEERRGTA